MCRQPENSERHMECACYCSDKVSAIGLTPPRSPANSVLRAYLCAFARAGHAADEAASAEIFETLADGLAFFAVEALAAEG